MTTTIFKVTCLIWVDTTKRYEASERSFGNDKAAGIKHIVLLQEHNKKEQDDATGPNKPTLRYVSITMEERKLDYYPSLPD